MQVTWYYIEKTLKSLSKKKKNLELISEFSKVAEYNITIKKFIAFLYTKSEISEKEIKKTIPF